MNYSTAVFLINPTLRAIKVAYQPRTGGSSDGFDEPDYHEESWKNKHVKVFKTLDPNITKDSLVVVPTGTRYGFTVGKVVEVDVPVDYDSDAEVKWVVDMVNKPLYDKVVADEAEYIKQMRLAEEEAKKKELRDKMTAFAAGKFDTLAIAGTVIAKIGE